VEKFLSDKTISSSKIIHFRAMRGHLFPCLARFFQNFWQLGEVGESSGDIGDIKGK
jgi:hypothetical protein